MRDSKEYLTATAGQWTGSLLCEHEFVVFVIVCGRQKEGGSCGFVVVVGLLGGGRHPGHLSVLGGNSQKAADRLHS